MLSLQKTLAEAKRSACSISSVHPAGFRPALPHLQTALPTPVQGACLLEMGTTILLSPSLCTYCDLCLHSLTHLHDPSELSRHLLPSVALRVSHWQAPGPSHFCDPSLTRPGTELSE